MTAVRWCAEGKIPAVKVDSIWQIDPVAADAMLAETQDITKPNRASAQPAPAPSPQPPDPAPRPASPSTAPPPQKPAGTIPTLADAQRAKMVYQAEREKLALLREREELLPIADVKAEAFALARQVRDAMLGIPDRLAQQLAAQQDPRACHQLLTNEIQVALRGLAHA